MRALALDYQRLSPVEIEVPEPLLAEPDHVLFRILEIGLCGTDRGLIAGRFGRPPAGESLLILGHEAIGEVVAAGENVTRFRPGDLVTPMIRRACQPACRFCAASRRDLCLSGSYTERGIIGAHGYFTQLAVDHQADLVPIPSTLRDVAVLIEPLSVVEKSLRLAFRSYPGEPQRALVIGAGPIGILSALVLLARGLEVTVHSLEPASSPRARLLQQHGAVYCASDPPAADIVIEAAGVPQAGFLAIRKLNPAGVAVILGAGNGSGEFPFHDLITGNRTVIGSVNADKEAFTSAAADLESIGPPKFAALIERTTASDWARTLLNNAPSDAAKWVHVWER